MWFHMFLAITFMTKLAAANVTLELIDSGILSHVTTQASSRLKSFTANLTQVKIVVQG